MGRWKTGYLILGFGGFLGCLVWLSWLPEETDWEMKDYELKPFSEEDWQAFLRRRSLELPSLASSLDSLDRAEGREGIEQATSVLVQHALLPYDDPINCLPRKFGYTQEQADALFNPNRRYPRCGNPQAASLSLQRK